MQCRKNGRGSSEYLDWEREDLEGHTKCLQIFAGLDKVCIAPEGVISEHGITMLRNQL